MSGRTLRSGSWTETKTFLGCGSDSWRNSLHGHCGGTRWRDSKNIITMSLLCNYCQMCPQLHLCMSSNFAFPDQTPALTLFIPFLSKQLTALYSPTWTSALRTVVLVTGRHEYLLRFSCPFFLLALILALKNSYSPFCSQPSLKPQRRGHMRIWTKTIQSLPIVPRENTVKHLYLMSE